MEIRVVDILRSWRRNAEFDIRLFVEDKAVKKTYIVSNKGFCELSEDTATWPEDSVLHITRRELQELVSMLWSLGVRPAEAEGSVGQLDATNKHLKDMQTITFRLLEDKLK